MVCDVEKGQMNNSRPMKPDDNPMSPEQRYLFDLNGYLHLKGVHEEKELKEAQAAADRYITTPPEELPSGFYVDGNRYVDGFAFDKSLERLVCHPKTWPLILEFTEDRPRLSGGTLQVSFAGTEHDAYRLHCAREDNGPENSQFEVRNGKVFCNNFAVFHYLSDVHPGDGGLVVVPGSHKSQIDRPLHLFNEGTMNGIDEAPEGVLNITPEAGDVVIMTESLTHGALAWRPQDRYRAVLMLRYSTRDRRSSLVNQELRHLLEPKTQELVSFDEK